LEVAGKKDNGAAVFDQAAHALDYVLSKNPEYPEAGTYLARAHMLLGNALYANNNIQKALSELNMAVAELERIGKPDALPDQVRLLLGTALVARGNAYLSDHKDKSAASDSEEASEVMGKIPTSSPQSGLTREWLARALTLRAHVQTNARRYQNAVDDLREALNIFSPYPEASRALGLAYTELGFGLIKSGKQADEAHEDFGEAINYLTSVQGAEDDTKFLLGRAYLGQSAAFELQNRHQDAKVMCNEALTNLQQVPKMKLLLPSLENQCATIGRKR
jgi:tetratricopeptide (TPR) repeat protein